MNQTIYKKTRYPGIKQHIKNGNYIVDMYVDGKRSSISTIDGNRNGQKILDIKTALKIRTDPSIIKRFSLSVNNKTTLDEAFEMYMYDATHNTMLAPRTLERKRLIYNIYLKPKYGAKRLFSITQDDMLQVKIEIEKRNKKSSSKYTCLKEIKSYFNWLKRKHIIDLTPTEEIKQFKKERLIHDIWMPSQVESFRKEAKKDFDSKDIFIAYKARMICLLVNLDYGMSARIGETRALQDSKILYDRNAIKISANINSKGEIEETTKTDVSTAVLDVPHELIEQIIEYKRWIEENLEISFEKDTPLFFNPSTMKPYSSGVINSLFKLYSERANLPHIPIYNLRHSGVALMQAFNYEMYVIQDRVRHKNIETTIDTYGYVGNAIKQKLIKDIERFF